MPSGTEVQLLCTASPHATVSSFINQQVPDLEASGQFNASWDANLGSIPWYSTSEDLECTATLIFAEPIFGNNLTNDVSEVDLRIESWTTPPVVIPIGDYEFKIPSAFMAGLLVLFAALVLLSRGLDEDQDRLHASCLLYTSPSPRD